MTINEKKKRVLERAEFIDSLHQSVIVSDADGKLIDASEVIRHQDALLKEAEEALLDCLMHCIGTDAYDKADTMLTKLQNRSE